MKRVLVVAANNLGIGGIQSVIIEIERRLSKDFYFDFVVFDHIDTYYEKECKKVGRIFTIPYYTNGFKKKIDFYVRGRRLYSGISKILKEYGPYDVVHCHNYFEAGIVLKAAKEQDVPIRIAHCHSCMPIAKKKIIRRLYYRLYRDLILNNSTACLACSSVAGDYLFGPGSKYNVIGNPVDTTRFPFSPVSDSLSNPWSFIQVGRYGFPKNPVFSLKVIAEIIKQHPETIFTLVGEGNVVETEEVNRTIETLGIENNVELKPADSDIPKLLKKHNIMLFPSSYEGLGTVLIEAQFVGLKCFASASVPRETDLGFVDYIELSDGPAVWADKIIDYIEKNDFKRYKVDNTKYNIERIGMFYSNLYNGDKQEG